MNQHYILFRRAGIFYCEDTTSGKQLHLRTKDETEACTFTRKKQVAPLHMKLIIILFSLLLLSCQGNCSSVELFTNTVSYAAPTNFYMFDYAGEDYTTPFALEGSGIQYETHSPPFTGGSILFQLKYASNFPYKVHPTTQNNSVTTSFELKQCFDKYYHFELLNPTPIFSNLPPATTGKASGLTAVSSSLLMKTQDSDRYFNFCWIQIKTNIVVTVEITAFDPTTFHDLTNSLKSLKINKDRILKQIASQKW